VSRAVIYVKSVLAGLATLIVLLAVIAGAPLLAVTVMARLHGQDVYIGAVSFHVWPTATGVLLVSVAVSIWTFRGISRTS
jgi:hypothetical protein